MPKISALASGSTPGGSELVPVVQGGQTVYLTVEQIAARYGVHRPVTGTANEVTITNGDGAAGNPTASLPSSLTFTGKTITGGTFADPTALTGTHPFTGRIKLTNNAPTFDYASGVVGISFFQNPTSLTILPSKQFNFNRISLDAGGYIPITLGAGALAAGNAVYLEAQAGAPSDSNLYSYISALSNKGDGAAKTIYGRSTAQTGSLGVVMGLVGGIDVVAGSNVNSAALELDMSSGPDDIGNLILLQASAASRLRYGIFSYAALPYRYAVYQAWMATASHANARAFQVLNNAGGEAGGIQKDGSFFGPSAVLLGSVSGIGTLLPPSAASSYVWTLPAATDTLVGKATTDTMTNKTFVAPVLGDATATTVTASTSLIAASAANGITITQAAVTRNHVNGSMTFAAGSAAGNTFAIATGGSSRVSVADAQVSIIPNTASTSTVSGSLINAGGFGNVGKIFAGDDINTAGVFKVGANQVVGARDTGWTAMTGTPDESTAYATGSVTLAQLAGRVMALQTALTTHGLIGT